MAAPVTYASVKQFTGIAKEVTPGTPVAMTATLLDDSMGPEDKYTFLKDKSYRGVMANDAFNEIAGVRYADISLGGPVYGDTIPWVLGNLMGDMTDTGASAPFSHKAALLNSGGGQPTTHTLTHYTGMTPTVGARVYSSTCFSQAQFTFNAATGLFVWTGKANAWASAPAAAAPTAAPSSVKPVAAWVGQVGIGGTVIGSPQANIAEGKITIMRELENEFTVNGVQDPYIIQRGGLSASFDLTFIASGETPLGYMTANTQPQVQIIFSNGLSGSSLSSVQFDIQQAAFTTAKPEFNGKAVKWTTSGVCVLNTTNVGTSGGYGPLTVTVQNAITAGTYV